MACEGLERHPPHPEDLLAQQASSRGGKGGNRGCPCISSALIMAPPCHWYHLCFQGLFRKQEVSQGMEVQGGETWLLGTKSAGQASRRGRSPSWLYT